MPILSDADMGITEPSPRTRGVLSDVDMGIAPLVEAPSMLGGVARKFTEGVPILGPAVRNANAALSAAVAPYTDGGLADDDPNKLTGPTFGERYQQARSIQDAEDKAFEAQHPIASKASEIAGGVAGFIPAAETAIGAKALGLGGGKLLSRAWISAATNAAIGGADAAVRGDNIGEGAAVSGLTGAAAPLLGRAVGKVVEGLRPGAAIPSVEELKDAASAGYDALRNSGVTFDPSAVASLAQQTEQSLTRDGLRPMLAPKTFSVLSDLQKPPAGATSNFADLHALRRVLGDVAASPDATERLAASRTMNALDGFLSAPPKGAVLAGNAKAAADQLAEANANYAAAKTSEGLQGKIDSADLQAASANSGGNFENALRQRLRGILNSPSQRRGYLPQELVAMQSVVRGDTTANVLRVVGNALGGGGGLGAMVSGTSAALAGAGPLGYAVPLAGAGIKKMGNMLAANRVAALDDLIRSRAPASFQALQAKAIRQAQAARMGNATNLLTRSSAPIFGSLAPVGQ